MSTQAGITREGKLDRCQDAEVGKQRRGEKEGASDPIREMMEGGCLGEGREGK